MKKEYLNRNIIGSDETGVGDYLTPLVACAVLVNKNQIEELEKIKIVDSKKLSDKQIQEIASKLKNMVSYSISHLTQKGYNKLNESFNANELKMFLHIKAINNLEQRNKNIDLIIIDQFSNENAIQKYYRKLLNQNFNFVPFKSKIKLVVRGEQEHIAVAASSILARDFFIEYMKKQNKKWNTVFPLGTNKIVEQKAKEFVLIHGRENLKEVAKLKFKTTEKLFGDNL